MDTPIKRARIIAEHLEILQWVTRVEALDTLSNHMQESRCPVALVRQTEHGPRILIGDEELDLISTPTAEASAQVVYEALSGLTESRYSEYGVGLKQLREMAEQERENLEDDPRLGSFDEVLRAMAAHFEAGSRR